MIKDYYKILNIERDSSENDIKKAYRDLALKLHPDRNDSPSAHDDFIELNEAFQILSDKSKRAKYEMLYGHYFGTTKQKVDENIKADFEADQKEAREKSEKVADSNYTFFVTEILVEMVGTALISGVGTILKGSGEVLGDIIGNIDL